MPTEIDECVAFVASTNNLYEIPLHDSCLSTFYAACWFTGFDVEQRILIHLEKKRNMILNASCLGLWVWHVACTGARDTCYVSV